MIRHVIREERSGGYWLLRDEGRVLELSPTDLNFLKSLQERNDDAPVAFPANRKICTLAQQHRLHTETGWQGVRWVGGNVPGHLLPADAAAAPKRIYFEVTRACNLACRSCFNASRLPLSGELSLAEVLDVNRQAWEMGVFEIRYTGGECTTIPWFPEVIEDARRRGFYISIGSNGVYSEETLEWLPNSGIDWFIISLDGARETNDQVRGKGTFDKVITTLRALSVQPRIRVRLNMVVARHNVSEIESVAQVATEHDVESINLIPLRPYGRSLREMVDDMFDQRDFYRFIREVNRLRSKYPNIQFSTTIDLLDPQANTSHDLVVQKKSTCAAGVEACVIGPLGDVYGCSYSPASFPDSDEVTGRKIFIAGNLRHERLSSIWRDSSRWAVFRDLATHKHPKCLGCNHYQVRCSGSCPIMAWFELGREGKIQGTGREIGQVCDPYCFADLLEHDQESSTMSEDHQ